MPKYNSRLGKTAERSRCRDLLNNIKELKELKELKKRKKLEDECCFCSESKRIIGECKNPDCIIQVVKYIPQPVKRVPNMYVVDLPSFVMRDDMDGDKKGEQPTKTCIVVIRFGHGICSAYKISVDTKNEEFIKRMDGWKFPGYFRFEFAQQYESLEFWSMSLFSLCNDELETNDYTIDDINEIVKLGYTTITFHVEDTQSDMPSIPHTELMGVDGFTCGRGGG
jgi:hypothetical protein